jgi:DNA polymerase-3 subunit beta
VTLKLTELAAVLGQVAISCAKESTRYAVAGALLVLTDGKLEAVSTDGHRLSLATLEAHPSMPLRVVIPTSVVKILAERPDDPGCEIQIHREGEYLSFRWSNHELVLRLVESPFPDYAQVIPANPPNRVTLKRDDLDQAIGKIKAAGKPVKASLKITDHEATVTTGTPETGVSEVKIPAHLSGQPIEVGFDSRYLKDYLSVAGEDLELKFINPENPVLFQSPGQLHPSQYLCMPLQ